MCKYILVVSVSLFIFSSPARADLARGKELFAQRCASCHGDAGKGDGPVAASLPEDQRPRNLAEGKFKFATDDAKKKQLLKTGGAANGLSPLMPPQPDLLDPDIDSIIEFVNTLSKK